MPAFAAAAEAGYGVELDVLLSRDEVPVINHDVSLRRVAGLGVRVGDLTAQELTQVRLGGTDEGVPTLAEALQVLQRVPVMVEIKQGRPRAGKLERKVAEVVAVHPGPWCVAGFNPTSLRWFRRHHPDAIRAMTASPLIDMKLPGLLLRRLAELRDLPSVAPHAVSYDLDALPTEVTDRWRERGGALITWTAVGEEGLARARALADNVIFEHVLP